MVPKKYRLTTKDVNYILSQRRYIKSGDFLIYNIPQYTNKPYNQFGIQLSSKLHKRSTKRNILKRVYYDMIRSLWLLSKKNKHNKYSKYIVLIDKSKISKWTDIVSLGKDQCILWTRDIFKIFFE